MTDERASRFRIARLIPAAIVSGLVGGAVAGLGARLIMFAVRLANPAYSGATTHAGFVNGVWTVQGTVSVIVTGAFFGVPGGVVYLLVRRFLRPTRVGVGACSPGCCS